MRLRLLKAHRKFKSSLSYVSSHHPLLLRISSAASASSPPHSHPLSSRISSASSTPSLQQLQHTHTKYNMHLITTSQLILPHHPTQQPRSKHAKNTAAPQASFRHTPPPPPPLAFLSLTPSSNCTITVTLTLTIASSLSPSSIHLPDSPIQSFP